MSISQIEVYQLSMYLYVVYYILAQRLRSSFEKLGRKNTYYFLGGFLSWKLYFKTDGAMPVALFLFSVKDPNQKFVRILIFFLFKC